QQACLEHYRREKLPPTSRIELSDDIPEALVSWLARCIERVRATPPRLPKPPRASAPTEDSPQASDTQSLAERVERLLQALRPDTAATPRQPENENLRIRVLAFNFEDETFNAKSLPWSVSSQLEARD